MRHASHVLPEQRCECDDGSDPDRGGEARARRARPRRQGVARALRDAGHEVIYTGLHQTPEQIVETAIQEDADVIGLSVLSGAHMTLFKKLIGLLASATPATSWSSAAASSPRRTSPPLEEMGVAKIFTPGATHRPRSRSGSASTVVDDSSVQA